MPCCCRSEAKLWETGTSLCSLSSLLGLTLLCWSREDRKARFCSRWLRRDTGGRYSSDLPRNEAIKSIHQHEHIIDGICSYHMNLPVTTALVCSKTVCRPCQRGTAGRLRELSAAQKRMAESQLRRLGRRVLEPSDGK